MRVAFVQHDPFVSVLAGLLSPAPLRVVPAPVTRNHVPPPIAARVDVVDNGDRFTVKVDLPGVNREDISVAVEGARVAVSATGREPVTDDGASKPIVLRAERRSQKYARTLELPVDVDADAADASFENGVLTLALPKRVKAAQIAVR